MIASLRDKPYAAEHFRGIVRFARENNRFYARWIEHPEEPPILDRATALANNEEILGGFPETGLTSGSTGNPVRTSFAL